MTWQQSEWQKSQQIKDHSKCSDLPMQWSKICSMKPLGNIKNDNLCQFRFQNKIPIQKQPVCQLRKDFSLKQRLAEVSVIFHVCLFLCYIFLPFCKDEILSARSEQGGDVFLGKLFYGHIHFPLIWAWTQLLLFWIHSWRQREPYVNKNIQMYIALHMFLSTLQGS